MDTNLEPMLTKLAADEVMSLRNAQGRGVTVFSGQVWITQDGDLRDIVIGSGESFEFDRQGLALVQALQPTRLVVFEEAPAGAMIFADPIDA